MKKIICFLLILMLTFSVVGCSSENPEKTVSSFLDSFFYGDFEEANGYVLDAEDISYESAFAETTMESDAELDEALQTAYEKSTYEILSSTIDGDTAEVETKITVPNLGSIFSEIIQEALPLAFVSAFTEDASDEEMDEFMSNMLIDKLNSDDIPMVTKTVNINLVKEDGTWLIEMDDILLDALSGNMSTILDLFGE